MNNSKKNIENATEKVIKKSMEKADSAITLIALIVTIIILLILAGVVISQVLGNEGIIHKAKK